MNEFKAKKKNSKHDLVLKVSCSVRDQLAVSIMGMSQLCGSDKI